MDRELSKDDYRRVWDKFEKDFNFFPSVDPKMWPGIDEPSPSITLSLTEHADREWPDEQVFIGFFQKAFNLLNGQARIRYILDWSHKCHYAPKVFPNRFWVYPDGDYAICLSEDMQNGTFGHPWEKTICIFGEELLEIVCPIIKESGFVVLRESG